MPEVVNSRPNYNLVNFTFEEVVRDNWLGYFLDGPRNERIQLSYFKKTKLFNDNNPYID